MKRDWDLVRQILLQVEALPSVADSLGPEAVAGYDEQVVAYHMWLLNDAGLIEGSVKKMLSGDIVVIVSNLTWEGHEFLDSIRRDNVWAQLKDKAAALGTDLPFDVVKATAVQLLQRSISGS